jgi:hypothetical protein
MSITGLRLTDSSPLLIDTFFESGGEAALSLKPNVFVDVFSGPLAMHSFIRLSSVSPSRRRVLPAVNVPLLRAVARKISNSFSAQHSELVKTFREMISASFSSISVLNASFRISLNSDAASHAVGHTGQLDIDLPLVREAYSIIMGTENDQVSVSIGNVIFS